MKHVVAIAGPTASGKTALALELKEYLDIEVISADSRQVYKDMNIGTCKPTHEQRKVLVHHLIDIVSPSTTYSLKQYLDDFDEAYSIVSRSNRIPLTVGGTGLYITHIEKGLCGAPGGDERIRAMIRQEIGHKGRDEVYKRLAKVDPEAAGKIHPSDTNRLIRYLEVYLLTGKPISWFWKNQPPAVSRKYKLHVIFINPGKQVLEERIKERCDRMVKNGLLDEIAFVIEKYGKDCPGMNTIGYAEFKDYISGNEHFEDCYEKFVRNTIQYAKRQVTWFKKEQVELGVESISARELSEFILNILEEKKAGAIS